MRRKYPRSVVIGGQRFSIVIEDLENGDWGQMDFDNRKILISPKCLNKSSTLRETLRHEIMHAALSVAGVSFSTKYNEETIVRALENVFFPAWDKFHKKLHENEV
jgi:hypothetical protein